MSVLATVTFFAPAVPAGVTAVIEVELATTTLVAEVPPMVTVAPLTNPVPVIVIAVPPSVEPEEGEVVLIVGAETVLKLRTVPGDHIPPTLVHAV